MQIWNIIAAIASLIWIIVAAFQWHSKYSSFFILISFGGLIGFITYNFKLGGAQNFYLASAMLMPPSLYKSHFQKQILIYLFIGVLIYFFSSFFLDESQPHFFELLIFIIVFLIILSRIVKSIYIENMVKIFECVLGAYLFSLIIKYIPLLNEGESGLVFYYLTTFFQIFIGIFFIFAREDNPKLIFKLPQSFSS